MVKIEFEWLKDMFESGFEHDKSQFNIFKIISNMSLTSLENALLLVSPVINGCYINWLAWTRQKWVLNSGGLLKNPCSV